MLTPGRNAGMLSVVMSSLTRLSPAKINLTLRVGNVRDDGFHEIESLVARVSLCDTVTVTPRDDQRWTVACDDPSLPSDEDNLAWQAVRRLAEAAGLKRGVHVAIEKRIPAGAGLGGGSSNAATVLTLLNELWGVGYSTEELGRIGAEIGSDVPLFLYGPVCILRGRGELIESVSQPLSADVLLFLPEIHCATPAVYGAWDRMSEHPARPPLKAVLDRFDEPARLAEVLFNDLEAPAAAVSPELATLAERLREVCPGPVRMTGSGSAFFCLVNVADTQRAVRAAGLNVRMAAVHVQA